MSILFSFMNDTFDLPLVVITFSQGKSLIANHSSVHSVGILLLVTYNEGSFVELAKKEGLCKNDKYANWVFSQPHWNFPYEWKPL